MVSAEAIPPLAINGWRIYAHPLFLDQLDALISEVHQLRRKDPQGYRHKNASKRLAAIARLMLQDIPRDPARKEFLQGSTLGANHRHWRRAKFFQQFRLFFRFQARSKVIVLGWVNNTDSPTTGTNSCRTPSGPRVVCGRSTISSADGRDGLTLPPDPHDPRQMVEHLDRHPTRMVELRGPTRHGGSPIKRSYGSEGALAAVATSQTPRRRQRGAVDQAPGRWQSHRSPWCWWLV